jgi:hypothetical protein
VFKGSFHQLEIFIIFNTEEPAYHWYQIVAHEANIVMLLSGLG